MKSTKILIVEDEVLIAEHLKDYLISFGFTDIALVHTKKNAVQAIEHLKPDLILLDLHLQAPMDGFEIAKVIDEKGHPPYIFITANADLLIIQEAIHTKAAAYITKPVRKSDLFAAIQITVKTIPNTEEPFLAIRENNATLKIVHKEILYVESSGNYINIFTKTQKQIARHSLDWAENHLPKHQFMRIHRSYLINMSAVKKISTKSVFIGQIEIPISRSNASKVTEYLKKMN